jgi:hypothetical protein
MIAITVSVLAHAASVAAAADTGMPLVLSECTTRNGATAANQTFALTVVAPYTSAAAVSMRTAAGFSVCFQIATDVVGLAPAGTVVTATPCGGNPMNLRANQYWSIGEGNTRLASLQVGIALFLGDETVAAPTVSDEPWSCSYG